MQVHVMIGQDIPYARKMIDRLTSASMHGRSFEFNGLNKAASFLVKEFQNNRVSTVGSTYDQWFTVSINTFPGPVRLGLPLLMDTAAFI